MAIEKINVPDLGEADQVEVIELLVKVGQAVEENESLLVLESDKAAMEIPAPAAGVIRSIAVNLGDRVSSGSPMATLEVAAAGGEKPEEPKRSEEPKRAEEPKEAEKTEKAAKPSPPAAKEEAAPVEVRVPDLGTGDEVDVIEVHVKEGDVLAADDPLITLESDKAAMEVPAPRGGTVLALKVAAGDKVRTGSELLILSAPPDEAPAPPASSGPAAPSASSEPAAPSPSPEPSASAPALDAGRVYAGPAVRKLARELGVDLAQVSGTGAKSRVTKEDLQRFVRSRVAAPGGEAAAPDVDFSRFGEVETISRSRLEKTTAANMRRNWTTVPHVAHFDEADVTDLDAFRAELAEEAVRRGVKLTFMPFLLKACAKALAEHPRFNVSLHSSGERLIRKKYCHIGMAVATEAGLLVPVVRDVDRKSVWELAGEVMALSGKARDRKLAPDEMRGACFTISSLGAIGGTGFTPIINAPEVAILGVARTAVKPVFADGEFRPRSMLPLTLCYDHRAVNGADAGRFCGAIVRLLGDIRRLAL